MSKKTNVLEENKEIIKCIESEVQFGDNEKKTLDAELDFDSHKETSEFGRQYDERNKLYTDLLNHHIKMNGIKADKNISYKNVFFWSVMITMFVCVGVPLLFIGVVVFGDWYMTDSLPIVIGGAASIVSALIVLPKIIAEHLFPTNEDENMIGLVKEMQKNDSEIRRNHQHKEPAKWKRKTDENSSDENKSNKKK